MNDFTTPELVAFLLLILVVAIIVHVGMSIVCRIKSYKMIPTKEEQDG